MSWYHLIRQAAKLSPKDRDAISHLEFSMRLNSEALEQIIEQAKTENRPLSPQEEIYRRGFQYQLAEIARKIEQIKQQAQLRPSTPRKPMDKSQQWLNRVVRQFGYTSDPREAGFIHPNGKLFDLSGRKLGGYNPGQRAHDHREVANGIDELNQITNGRGSRADAMHYWMVQTGGIRMHISEDWGFVDISKIPTSQQINAILRMSRSVKGLTVEASRFKGMDEGVPQFDRWSVELLSTSAQYLQKALQNAILFLKGGTPA